MRLLPAFSGVAMACALLMACEDESEQPGPAVDEPADNEGSPTSTTPGDASVGTVTDGKVSPHVDAANPPTVERADSGTFSADAADPGEVDASDAEVVTPSEPTEQPNVPAWESTTAPKDEAQTVCVDGKVNQSLECPLQACFPALRRFAAAGTEATARNYYSGATPQVERIEVRSEQLRLDIVFARPMFVSASSSELFDAVDNQLEVRLTSFAPDLWPVEELGYVRKTDITELSFEGGRVHFKGLGQVLNREQEVDAVLPSLCGGEHSFKLCTHHHCGYVSAVPNRALGWVMLDVDLPLVLEPLPVNTP